MHEESYGPSRPTYHPFARSPSHSPDTRYDHSFDSQAVSNVADSALVLRARSNNFKSDETEFKTIRGRLKMEDIKMTDRIAKNNGH